MIDRPTHLKLLDSAKDRKTKEEAKAEAYKKRAESKSNFYHEARINKQLVQKLKDALLISALVDDETGEALMTWTNEMIQEIVDSIEDDGPINK